MITRKTLLASAMGSALLLAACGNEAEEAAETGEVSTATLATLIGEAENLSTVSDVLTDAGLQGVFDGNAPYTMLAPTDDAFAGVAMDMDAEETRAARVAVIREHILPGYLTSEDIAAAIAASADGSVEMQTMGGAPLTFTMNGETIHVAGPDDTEADLLAGEMLGSNGVAIPVDGLLKTFAANQ